MSRAIGSALDFDLGHTVGVVRRELACSRATRTRTLVEEIGHFQAQISGIRRISEASFEIDDTRPNEPVNLAIKVLHAFGAAVAHGIEKRLAFRFTLFHVIPRAHGGLENFHGGDAPLAVLTRKQALRSDAAKSFREARTDALLVGKRENTDDPFHGLRGVDGV